MQRSIERLERRHLLTTVVPEIVNVSAFALTEQVELPRAGAITSADINQDGVADLIIADADLTIMLGNGTGGFEQSDGLPLSFSPSPESQWELLTRPIAISLSVGDVNHDGLLDVIVGGYEDLAIVLSAADDSGNWVGFQEPQSLEGSARKLELADLNRDGDLDLILLTGDHVFHSDRQTGPGSHLVEFKRLGEIQFGDGTGHFAPTREFAADELYVKELTGDDVPDLLVRDGNELRVLGLDTNGELLTTETYPITDYSGVEGLWPSRGTSPTATEYFFNVGPRYFINDDPYPDMLISNPAYDFGTGPDLSEGSYVAFGTEEGGFETPLRFAWAFTDLVERHYPDLLPPALLVDIDSNGYQDILIPYAFGDGISVVRQIETTSYSTKALNYTFPESPPVNQSLLIDFNRDGLLDVIANENIRHNDEGVVSILFGQPDGGFGDPTTLNIGHNGNLEWREHESQSYVYVSGWNKTSIRYAADLEQIAVRTVELEFPALPANTNNDGFIDYFVIESDPNVDTDKLILFESNPDGSNSQEVLFDEVPRHSHPTVVDLDGDGIDEFFFDPRGSERNWMVFLVDGNWRSRYTGKSLEQIFLESGIESTLNETQPDFNVEYSQTTVTVNFSETLMPAGNAPTTQNVALRFTAAHTVDLAGGHRPHHEQAERDIDNDGDLDLIVTHGEGVTVLLAVGEGDFDKDGRPTNSDLGILRQAVSNGQSADELPHLDVNRDDLLNSVDEESWIAEVARTKTGDVDLDGDVDFADFLVISQNYGKSTNDRSRGDLDGNGTVDDEDLRLLSADYGFVRDS